MHKQCVPGAPPFSRALGTRLKNTMKEGGHSDMIATISVLQLNKATQVMMTTQGS